MQHFHALFAALLLATLASHAADSPVITWASDPVRPDETILLRGDAFGSEIVVELARLPNTPDTLPKAGTTLAVETWETLQPMQADDTSSKTVVPKSWPQGVWACRVRRGDAVSEPVVLNAPEPWWWNGDAGESASPGGWLRVFGKSLDHGGASRAVLRHAEGLIVPLKPKEADAYALRFDLPADLAPGDCELFVHNGLGGDAAWRSAGPVMIRPRVEWKSDVFNVKDFGPEPEKALLAALEKAKANGGGIVHLPRGRYPMKGALAIPPNTVLRGESMELTSLYWPNFTEPPTALISGADYGIESITLYCQYHKDIVADTPESRRFFARRVRIRANCFFNLHYGNKEAEQRHVPARFDQCGSALKLRGCNFEVTDCDIYTSNYAIQINGYYDTKDGLRVSNGKPGIISRNKIRYGGRGYDIEHTERLIFEDNDIAGNNLHALGNDITTFYSSSCRHIYYARNHVHSIYGSDREIMTLDAAGGAYLGALAAVDGVKLTLAADPVFKGYAANTPRGRLPTSWVGAAVQVLDGKGVGQYRLVAAHEGREWEIDRPWAVAPDSRSLISITPFRGQSLFIDNRFEDGGAVQLYGVAHDSIIARNRAARFDGFLVWGINPHDWGYQPSWGCQFLDNQITEGNGYGERSGGFRIVAVEHNKPPVKAFAGPLVLDAIFRRNVLHNNAGILISGRTGNTLVEHCTVKNTETGIIVEPSVRGTLLRGNRFENVTLPVRQPTPAQKALVK